MNKNRRDALGGVIYDLESASDKLTQIGEDEQESVDNLPESLQYSERADKMQEAIAYIDEAIAGIDEASESIRNAME